MSAVLLQGRISRWVQRRVQAAIKVQAIARGRKARQASPAPEGKKRVAIEPSAEKTAAMEAKMVKAATSNLGAFGSAKGGGSKWGLVKESAGLKFDSWDMALEVVPAGWRGELARDQRGAATRHQRLGIERIDVGEQRCLLLRA